MRIAIALLFGFLAISPAQAWTLPWQPRDLTPPTTPANVTGSAVSTSQSELQWQASTDKNGVRGYVISRDGLFLSATAETSFTDIDLTAGKTYSYTVTAFDAAKNRSRPSKPVKITMPGAGGDGGNGGGSDGGAIVGYLGCSMTMNAVEGALAQGGKVWNPVPTYSSGGVWRWAKDLSDKNSYWAEFQAAQNQQPTKIFWLELCALGNDAENETYDNALKVIAEIKRRIPGATVFVSAQPSYLPANHECKIAGTGGQARMAELAKQLVANKVAQAGPVIGPLDYPAETLTDGCHGNTAGNWAMGKQLIDFNWGTDTTPPTEPPVPPVTSSEQATGLYVVDDGDPDFSKALDLPYVDGALVRTRRSQNDTRKAGETKSTYSFATVCSKISQAHKAGKKVSLVNYPLAPSWELEKLPATEKWTHPNFKEQPMPWNVEAQGYLKEYAEAQANFVCDGYKIKEHPALANVDTPILGMLSIRDAPSYDLQKMKEAVLASVKIWHDAFAVPDDKKIYYTGLFPLNRNVNDAIAVWDAVEAAYPMEHAFMENLTGAGPSGTLADPLKSASFKMFQSCGYFYDTSRIKCTFSNPDSPQIAYDTVVKPMKGKYWEIYPDDFLYEQYKKTFEAIHTEIWQKH